MTKDSPNPDALKEFLDSLSDKDIDLLEGFPYDNAGVLMWLDDEQFDELIKRHTLYSHTKVTLTVERRDRLDELMMELGKVRIWLLKDKEASQYHKLYQYNGNGKGNNTNKDKDKEKQKHELPTYKNIQRWVKKIR